MTVIPIRRARLLSASVAVPLAVMLGLAACGGGKSGGVSAAQLSQPLSLPAGTFTSTSNKTFDLAQEAKGSLTLVFFGYTHCPDECPTTMADLGAALRSLPADVSKNVQVVFVTSDPDRDTPAVMNTWLSNFDAGVPRPFIGLTTKDVATVDAYGGKLGVPLLPPQREPDGTIDVTHGAQVLAFSPTTATARYAWLIGTTVKQFASDIEKLESGTVT